MGATVAVCFGSVAADDRGIFRDKATWEASALLKGNLRRLRHVVTEFILQPPRLRTSQTAT